VAQQPAEKPAEKPAARPAMPPEDPAAWKIPEVVAFIGLKKGDKVADIIGGLCLSGPFASAGAGCPTRLPRRYPRGLLLG